MKLQKKLAMALVAAGVLSAGVAQAAIDNFASGNSSVLLSLWDGTSQSSALFDLGPSLSSLLGSRNTAGLLYSTNLNSGDYASTYGTFVNYVTTHGSSLANVRWNVIAGDSTGASTIANSFQYLSTTNANVYGATTSQPSNTQVGGFGNVDSYVNANANLASGNHGSVANGADFATIADGAAYFAGTGGFGSGGNWQSNAPFNSTQLLNTAQNFWYFSNTGGASTAKATRLAYGVDGDGIGGVGNVATEFGKFNVTDTGLVTLTNPVPEADTWAMFAAGLIAVGAMARRRMAV